MVLTVEKDMKNIASRSISEISTINSDLESFASDKPEVIIVSKGRILRNLLIVSVSYLLFFSGFFSVTNLESTMNAAQGIGPDSQAVIYLCSMMSCFLPEMMIGKLGCKFTFAIALLLSCPYIASNFQLRWDTMMTAAVLYGLASGPLNAALTMYLDEMAVRFKAVSNESRENIEACIFGFFMFFAECTQIIGNIISYYVLENDNNSVLTSNFSAVGECGVYFRPNSNNETNSNLTPPSDHERYILIGVFLGMGVLAAVNAILLDPLKNDVKEVKGCQSIWRRFIGAVKHLRNPHQLLLLPLSIYTGIEGTFYANEVTEAFIACSWGVHHVGFVTICFGVCGALMAILIGPLVKCVSQMSVIILAAVINVVTCGLLFAWQPSPDAPAEYFAFAGAWGMTDAMWWSQIPALYGLMFPNDREAAFSNFFFWSFLGYFLSYSYANYLTVAVKIYIMLTFLVTGIILYVIGQIKLRCSSRSGYVAIGDSE